jgi:hypothetical protein
MERGRAAISNMDRTAQESSELPELEMLLQKQGDWSWWQSSREDSEGLLGPSRTKTCRDLLKKMINIRFHIFRPGFYSPQMKSKYYIIE